MARGNASPIISRSFGIFLCIHLSYDASNAIEASPEAGDAVTCNPRDALDE